MISFHKLLLTLLLGFTLAKSQTFSFSIVNVKFESQRIVTIDDSLRAHTLFTDTLLFNYSLTFDTLLTDIGTLTVQIGDTTNVSNGYSATYTFLTDVEGATFLQDNTGALGEPLAYGYNFSRRLRITKNSNFKWLTLAYSKRSGVISQKYYVKIEII